MEYNNDTKFENLMLNVKRRISGTDLTALNSGLNGNYPTAVDDTSNQMEKQASMDETMNDGSKIKLKRKSGGESQEKLKKRKSKKEETGRTHVCQMCGKSYLSYPALYTHKRNKHNIIPITGKPEIFKNVGSGNGTSKFKYNVMETTANVKGITESIISEYSKISQSVYYNPDSVFFKPHYRIESDPFLNLLQYYHYSNLERIKIPKPTEKNSTFVDNILVTYLILLIEVTRDNFFFELIIRFVFLLREYLNLTGWDHMCYLYDYGLCDDPQIQGDFCSKINCEEIPELINDFLTVFIEMDEFNWISSKKELIDITQNFCYWLFINGLTNYKLTKNEGIIVTNNDCGY